MPQVKVLSDCDIKLLQEWSRCINELSYARGINKLSLIAYKMDIEERLEKQGLLEYVNKQ